MQRPFGITILAILAIFSGLWGVLKGLVIAGIGGAVATWVAPTHPLAGAVVGGIAAAWGIIALVLGLFLLVFGVGAWGLKAWAWSLGVVTEAGNLIWSLLVALGPGTLRGQLPAILVAGGILFYLMTPEVKGAFGRGA